MEKTMGMARKVIVEERPATASVLQEIERGRLGMGWLPDYPDWRDYTPGHEAVAPQLARLNLAEAPERAAVPPRVDLREWCSPVEDQGPIGSCTANAAAGLVEYFERRAFGKHLELSRLFLYKATRNLLHWTGDTGAFTRTTMGALRLFGAPPETHYPYDVAAFDEEPPAFCYAFAQNFQALHYVRLDAPRLPGDQLVARIQAYLAAGSPAMFGFTVFSTIEESARDGNIPLPAPGDRTVGGHAVVAVGYDDNARIRGTRSGNETVGGFLIRNSWGPAWGDDGYGWLPYEYVHRELTQDWWTLIRKEWVDTGEFGL